MVKKISKFILLIVAILLCKSGYSQRIVDNKLLFYIDDAYIETDTMVSKINLKTADCYRCIKNDNGDDSCILITKTRYDSAGRIIELIKGNDLDKKQIDFVASYKWLTDTSMESIVKLPTGSTMISGNFDIDTIIKGKKKTICLYKADENKDIYVRSVYSMHGNGFWTEIRRYDLNDKLVEIYFPLGRNVAKRTWTEVAVGKNDSIITQSWDYDSYIIRSKNVYSKKGVLKEVWSQGQEDSFVFRSVHYYNDNGQLIVKNDIDQDNRLLSEERSFFKDKKLIRYTRDNDFNDSLFAEQVIYNNCGQPAYSSNYNSINGQNFIYKNFYDARHLLVRREYYINEDLQEYLRYEYR